MRIEWNDNAERQKDCIADYIFERFGYDRMRQYLDEVEHTTKQICDYPNLGSIDPLFSERGNVYRSVIVDRLSKLVYYVKEDTIRIAAFWDCRQEPQSTQIINENKTI